MFETPPSVLAVAVVLIGLAVLGFFMREGVVTSNIYKRGVKLYQEKNYKAAEAAFRQVIARHPSNDAVRLLLGDTLIQQQRVEEAIAQFKELAARAPKNADARLRLGMALIGQGKLEEATSTLETAKDLLTKQRQVEKVNAIEQLLKEISTQQSLT